jgi:acyl-CoA thioester hydrolase
MDNLSLEDFPLIASDKIRYADTDRQGHVNNAVFATFLETGRVELLYNKDYDLLDEGASFVIASLSLNFLDEIVWPGTVDIGTGILKIGNSSIKMHQRLYQNENHVATAETIIVQTRNSKSLILTEKTKALLEKWLLKR